MAYTTPTTGPLLQNPNTTNHMVQNVWKLLGGDELENTQPKVKEFMLYCHSIYPTDPHYSILMKEKIYNFIFSLVVCKQRRKVDVHLLNPTTPI
jgi:hypothetical protein